MYIKHTKQSSHKHLLWLGLFWLGLAWFGLVWLGLVWFGLAWLSLVWFGLAWFGSEDMSCTATENMSCIAAETMSSETKGCGSIWAWLDEPIPLSYYTIISRDLVSY